MKLFSIAHLIFCLSMAKEYRPEHAIPCDTIEEGYTCDPHKSRFWGEETPFYSTGSEESRGLPAGCRVDQISYLGRHGARGTSKEKTAETLRLSIKSKVVDYVLEKFPFLNQEVPLNPHYALLPLGCQQAYNAGIRLAQDYPNLAALYTPIVRSSPIQRVEDSARYLMQGFEDKRKQFARPGFTIWNPEDFKIVSDILGYPGQDYRLNSKQQKDFDAYMRSIESSQKAQLENLLGVGLPEWFQMGSFQYPTVEVLQRLCTVGTLALTSGEGIRDWCQLFSSEYFQKIVDGPVSAEAWYAGGPGDPHIPAAVVTWTKELGARLLGHEAGFFTLGPGASPLKQEIYVDMTHFENLLPTVVALGLFDPQKAPSLNRYTPPEETDGWAVSKIAPMGGRLVIERIQCDDWHGPFVRFILNDGVRNLPKFSTRTPRSGIYPVKDVLEHVAQILEQHGDSP